MLEVSHIKKIFNAGTVNEKVAINDLSITFNDGDFVTVIGGARLTCSSAPRRARSSSTGRMSPSSPSTGARRCSGACFRTP